MPRSRGDTVARHSIVHQDSVAMSPGEARRGLSWLLSRDLVHVVQRGLHGGKLRRELLLHASDFRLSAQCLLLAGLELLQLSIA